MVNTMRVTRLIAVILAVAAPLYVSAVSLPAEGVGSSYRDALFNALENALASSGRAVVQSSLSTVNGKITSNKLSVATSGFIKSYQVEDVEHSGSTFYVNVTVETQETLELQSQNEMARKSVDFAIIKSNLNLFSGTEIQLLHKMTSKPNATMIQIHQLKKKSANPMTMIVGHGNVI